MKSGPATSPGKLGIVLGHVLMSHTPLVLGPLATACLVPGQQEESLLTFFPSVLLFVRGGCDGATF